MDDIDIVIATLKKALHARNLIICVGSGCSVATVENMIKYPYVTWRGLLNEGILFCKSKKIINNKEVSNLKSDLDIGKYVFAATKLTEYLGGAESDLYRDWLGNTVGKLSVGRPELITTLASLNAPIITTNYDDLIEKVTGWPFYHQYSDKDILQKIIRGDEKSVLHIHGHWKHPSTVVLDSESYYKIHYNEPIQNLIQALLITKTFLFIGFGGGLEDPNFGPLISAYKIHFSLPHYQLVLNKDIPDYIPVKGIRPVAYGENYNDLEPFLRRLLTKSSEELWDEFFLNFYKWKVILESINKKWLSPGIETDNFLKLSIELQETISDVWEEQFMSDAKKTKIEDLIERMGRITTASLSASAPQQTIFKWITILKYIHAILIGRLYDLQH